MRLLAKVPLLADYDRGFKTCAVHQQTQRTYAIGEADEGNHALVLLDANLQVIATVEATSGVPEDIDNEDYEPIRDVAVHGDQVIVLTSNDHTKGSGLRMLDLDGQFLGTIAPGCFTNPQAVAASHGRAFVVDDNVEVDDEGEDVLGSKVLHVIDLQSGNIWQSVRFEFVDSASAILVDNDEIYIASCDANMVCVLRFAGSEA